MANLKVSLTWCNNLGNRWFIWHLMLEKKCCICLGLRGCKDYCRKTCVFSVFWAPTCPSQRGRTLKCRSIVPASNPNNTYVYNMHPPVLLTSWKFSTSELMHSNSYSLTYHKINFSVRNSSHSAAEILEGMLIKITYKIFAKMLHDR